MQCSINISTTLVQCCEWLLCNFSEEKKQEAAVKTGQHHGIVRQGVTQPWQMSCMADKQMRGKIKHMATINQQQQWRLVSIAHVVAQHSKVTGE